MPIGLIVVFLILLATAVLNFLTKEVATIGGMAFTAVFLVVFIASEHYHEKRRGAAAPQAPRAVQPAHGRRRSPRRCSGLTKPYRKLVAIRSTQNLFMLEKALAETDPETTDVVVMTAKFSPPGDASTVGPGLDHYDRAADDRRGRPGGEGRQGGPAADPADQQPAVRHRPDGQYLQVQELILGASNRIRADEQFEQIAFYWIDAARRRA